MIDHSNPITIIAVIAAAIIVPQITGEGMAGHIAFSVVAAVLIATAAWAEIGHMRWRQRRNERICAMIHGVMVRNAQNAGRDDGPCGCGWRVPSDIAETQ